MNYSEIYVELLFVLQEDVTKVFSDYDMVRRDSGHNAETFSSLYDKKFRKRVKRLEETVGVLKGLMELAAALAKSDVKTPSTRVEEMFPGDVLITSAAAKMTLPRVFEFAVAKWLSERGVFVTREKWIQDRVDLLAEHARNPETPTVIDKTRCLIHPDIPAIRAETFSDDRPGGIDVDTYMLKIEDIEANDWQVVDEEGSQ